ncbi:MAG: magnesium and cobalt transport protein CorA [Actinomycetota bacterium]
MLVDSAVYINGERSQEAEPGSGFTWVGLLDPKVDEIQEYQKKFSLHSLAVEDAVMGRQRPKLDVYPRHSFLILKTVMFDLGTSRIVVGDIGVFINEKFVVIVRHGDAIPMRSIRADLEQHPDRLKEGSTAVLHEVLDRLVDQYVDVAWNLQEDVESLEDMVFDDEVPAPSARLYTVKRELLEFRRAVYPLIEPLNRLASSEVPHIDAQFAPQFADVRDHLMKVIDDVNTMNDLMEAALHANLALIQVQQNVDMRKISAWVGIGAVPTMVAGIYGMNFENLPELQWKYGYYVVLGVLGAVSAGLFRVFRRNNWL